MKRFNQFSEAVNRGDLMAQAEGKKAARKGEKYDSNPYEKGSSRHLQWSKGHNSARAGMVRKEEADAALEENYHVIDKKTGKKVNKEPMSMGRALDHYDSIGGNAKGYAVVKHGDKRIKEDVELDEAKFNKGDSVKIKNVRKYDALAKDDKGTVIGMMSGKVMVKVGSGQMNIDPKDLILESAELDEALKKDSDDPCWKNYVQLGTKKKNGKEVPNCVPKEEVEESSKYEPAKPDPKAAARRKAIEAAQERLRQREAGKGGKSNVRRMGGTYGYGSYDESVEQIEENWATKAMAGKSPLKKKYQAPKDGEEDRAKRMKKKMYGNMMGGMKEEVELDEVSFTIPKSKAGQEYMSRKAKMRQDQHKEQDPKHAKTHAKNMVDMDKAAEKAAKKGVKMRDYGKDNWKVRNGVKRGKLPEEFTTEQWDLVADYLNENDISYDSLQEMSVEQLDEIIGKAIGGAFKVGAKAAVGAARLAGKGVKKAVYNKQGNVRGTQAAKNDAAKAQVEKLKQKRKEIVQKRLQQRKSNQLKSSIEREKNKLAASKARANK